MLDKRSNMQLSYLNPKPHYEKTLRDIIERAIGSQFYPPPGSEYYKSFDLISFMDTFK